MSVPTNLIPSPITGLPEYMGSSTLGYLPYVLEGRSYKVQFANIAAVGAVPSSRVIAAGTGLAGGGDLSENRVIAIAAGGVGFDQLALSGVVAGTYGSGSEIPILTVDSKGRVTSATTAALDVAGFVPTSRTITAGDGLTGGGSLANNITLATNFSATTPSALGTASAGTSVAVSRGDHVHPAVNLSDTTQTQGALPLGRGGTGDALSPVAGAVVYSTGTKFALTSPGTVGQVLVSNGTDEPQWQTVVGSGTVTSVDASGGTTGLSFTGGPVTTSGTLTLGGTLAVANGGTGASVAGTARTNLGAAASGANTDITSIALTTGTISATPTNGTDIVNKVYADSIAAGINFHQSVRLATAAALPANTYNNGSSGVGATLTANANGALTVDSVAAAVGNRILVKNEVTQANNGVYTVTQVGSAGTPYILTRAADFDSSGAGVDQIDAGDFFLVTAGSTQSNTSWVQQTPLPIIVGTTAIVFTQFAAPVLYSAGTGLTLAGTVFSITNTGVAASTYGSASSVPVLAINAQGQVTSASASSIAIAASQITSGTVTVAQGGTGATTLSSGYLVKGNGTSAVTASVVYDDGTNVGIGTSSPATLLHISGDSSPVVLNQNTVGSVAAFTALGVTYGASFGVNASGTYITSAANTVFSVSGSETMRITAAGGLAVGTTADPGAGNIGLAAGKYLQYSSTAYITPEDNVAGARIVTPGVFNLATGGTTVRMSVDTSGNVTLTNKIIPNVQTIASASTITPNANTDTQVSVTALAVPATIAAPSGTPSDGQSLVIRIEDNGTAQALTWTTGSSGAYRPVGITLPTTTDATKVMYIGFKYNSTDLRWDAIALSQEA